MNELRLVPATIAFPGPYSTEREYAVNADIGISGYNMAWHQEFRDSLSLTSGLSPLGGSITRFGIATSRTPASDFHQQEK